MIAGMTAAIAAFRAQQQPAIVQVFEVGTATMMAAGGAVKPVYQLMKDAGEPFDPTSLTEDYELGLALAEMGARAVLAAARAS